MDPFIKLGLLSILPLGLAMILRKGMRKIGLGSMFSPKGMIDSAKQMTAELKGYGHNAKAMGSATKRGASATKSGAQKMGRGAYKAADWVTQGALTEGKTARARTALEDVRRTDNSDLVLARHEGGVGYAAQIGAGRYRQVLSERGTVDKDVVRKNLGDKASAYLVGEDGGTPIPVPHVGSVDTGVGLNTENPQHWVNFTDVDLGGMELTEDSQYEVLSAIGMSYGMRNADGTDNYNHLSGLTSVQRERLRDHGDLTVAAMVPRVSVSKAEVETIMGEFNIVPQFKGQSGRHELSKPSSQVPQGAVPAPGRDVRPANMRGGAEMSSAASRWAG